MSTEIREAFEEWAKKEGFCVDKGNGFYIEQQTACLWIAWRAACEWRQRKLIRDINNVFSIRKDG